MRRLLTFKCFAGIRSSILARSGFVGGKSLVTDLLVFLDVETIAATFESVLEIGQNSTYASIFTVFARASAVTSLARSKPC